MSFEVKMYQALKYRITCDKFICKMRKRLGEKYYRYNLYVFVILAHVQDGLKKASSNMSEVFENKLLNQVTFMNSIEEIPHDLNLSDSDDSGFSRSSMSLRSDDMSEIDPVSAKPEGRIGRTNSELSLKHIKPELRFKQTVPDAIDPDQFQPNTHFKFESGISQASKSSQMSPSAKLIDQNRFEKYIYWKEGIKTPVTINVGPL